MDIKRALEFASNGDAVLFIGSGFSRGAINTRDTNMRTGGELARHLAEECGLPSETNLQDSADIYIERIGASELVQVLKEEFTAKNTTHEQKTIASMPWKRIYTTNYDNVFETSAGESHCKVSAIDPDDNHTFLQVRETLCIHLNGYIENLDVDTLNSSFKLTDTSYVTASIENSPWSKVFRQDIRHAKSVFFVGYSLFDLDIRRILLSTPELKDKTHFILSSNSDEVTLSRASRYGEVHTIGCEGFAAEILSDNYNIPRKAKPLQIGRSILEYSNSTQGRDPVDEEFNDFLMLGQFDSSLLMDDSTMPDTYACHRSDVTKLMSRLESGQARAAVLHSQIANGKTIALQMLASDATSRGWRVFIAKEVTEYAESEFKIISELQEKVLLIVDDYISFLKPLSGLALPCSERFAIVVSARSDSHDLTADELAAALEGAGVTKTRQPVGKQRRNVYRLPNADELKAQQDKPEF